METTRFKTALELKRQELLQSIRIQARQIEISNEENDPLDQVKSYAGRDEASALLSQLSHTLGNVSEALRSIAEGTYGICDECGDEISDKRLQSIPWAPYCIRCQERHEAGASRDFFTFDSEAA